MGTGWKRDHQWLPLAYGSCSGEYEAVCRSDSNGFLWPMGRAQENMKQYAGLTQAGYDAVKEVYPEAICIVHIDGGCDPSRYHFIFDGLKKYGAKWDMIGLSVYPYWAHMGSDPT